MWNGTNFPGRCPGKRVSRNDGVPVCGSALYSINYKIWENRALFKLDTNLKSPTGLSRLDLYVSAMNAKTKTKSQCERKKYRIPMHQRNTPIERFYTEIWDAEHSQLIGIPIKSTEFLPALPFFQEPYENALSVDRNSLDNSKVAPATPVHSISYTLIHHPSSTNCLNKDCAYRNVMNWWYFSTQSTAHTKWTPFSSRLYYTATKRGYKIGKCPPITRFAASRTPPLDIVGTVSKLSSIFP